MQSLALATIHAMSKRQKDKKLVHVNAFKAPEEWYAMIQKIADERGQTVGAAIQYLVGLGRPIYDAVRTAEQSLQDAATNEAIDSLKKKVM